MSGTAGAMMAMPMLVLNMGGEMVYILQQRLQAQSVPPEKARKVMQDVVRTMYSKKFVTELFKPQEMYSNQSTKQIFDKLAHSSIMRLNESSMEKLYDLMTMGVKFQVLSCTQPQQLLQVLLNHLEPLKDIVEAPQVVSLVDDAIRMTIETYGSLDNGSWVMLKQKLLHFFQGRRIKVSLFLQSGIQKADGTIVLSVKGPVPVGSEVPGIIRYYEAGSEVNTQTFLSKSAVNLEPSSGSFLDRSCTLGLNLYSKDAGALQPDANGVQTEATAAADKALSKSAQKRPAGPGASAKGGPGPGAKSTATAELNLLANLMGGSAKDTDHDHDHKPFKINLFPEDPFDAAQAKDGDESVRTITIDLSHNRSSAAKMLDDFDDVKAEAKGSKLGPGDDDDLLSLMDSAAK